MTQIGRKLYYELATGNPILDTGERQGCVVETTEAQDFQLYAALQPYQQSAVGVLQLNFGDYAQNFATYPWHIDITKSPVDETAIVWDTANPLGVTLAQVQAVKLAQIADLYNQKLAAGFTSSANGTALIYGYAATDQMKFMQVALEVLLSPTTAFPVTVHPKDGSDVSLTQTQYNQLVADISAFAKPLDAQQHGYITQVNACTTVDAVNSIVVSF